MDRVYPDTTNGAKEATPDLRPGNLVRRYARIGTTIQLLLETGRHYRVLPR